jgi:uncharacterized delta-60 repeat protein/uncharacterized repeat protein (TIGR01451 family)
MDRRDFNMQKSNSINKTAARYARQMAAMLIISVFISSSLVNRVKAAAGDLDPIFGNGGKVSLDINEPIDLANDVAIQVDGKIVAVGLTGQFGTPRYFTTVRCNPDGTLDTSFGVGGKVQTAVGGLYGYAFAVAIQANGKIVVGGWVEYTPPNLFKHKYFALARYNADGSLDTTFGSGGQVVTPFSHSDDLHDLVIQSDGRIVAVGWTVKTSNQSLNVAVLRYNANGSLDLSFGVGGLVEIDLFGDLDHASGVVIQPDGRILVCGRANSNPNPEPDSDYEDFLLVRLTTNGALDPSFGTNGKVVTDFFSKGDSAQAIALQPDGRILLGGSAQHGSLYSFALARYNADGSLDTTFGNAGKVHASTPAWGMDMILLPDGKIVMAGYSQDLFPNQDFILARFDDNGNLISYGSSGYVLTDFFGGYDYLSAVTLYGNDQVIAAGYATQRNQLDFALARYLGESVPNQADLSVSMTGVVKNDSTGKYITYLITIMNTGADPAYYVTLKDTIPANTTFYKFSANGWVISTPAVGGTGQVACSKSPLAPGETITFTLLVKVNSNLPKNTAITNTASLTSSFTADPNLANNTVTTLITVN